MGILLPRRRILQGAIAAPFVLTGPARAQMLLSGAGPAASPSDATATALAGLANSTWSSDLVIAGNHTSDVIPATNNFAMQAPGDSFNWGGSSVAYEFPGATTAKFTFSSGCYMPGQKKYILPGTGGHTDYAGNEIVWLDFTTLNWALTEHSCQWKSGPPCTGNACTTTASVDAGNPTSQSDTTWAPWPNREGRRSMGPQHTYSSCVWCPEISRGFTSGSGCWNNGGAVIGTYLWDGNGHWDQAHAYASGVPRGSGAPGATTSQWIASQLKIWSNNNPNALNHACLYDPLTNTAITTCDLTPTNQCAGDFNDATGPGVIVPDGAGNTQHLFWANDNDSIFVVPKVGSGATGQSSSRISFGGAVPTALQFGHYVGGKHCSGWFDFAGNYKPGSTKILVWDWGTNGAAGSGLYLLDTATLTFTGPLSGSAMPYTPNDGVNAATSAGGRLVFVASDYVSVGNYLPVGLIQSHMGECRFYKIPWSSL